jgi:hypothetical protein
MSVSRRASGEISISGYALGSSGEQQTSKIFSTTRSLRSLEDTEITEMNLGI